MNIRALGTLWSPMWMTDEPTQSPMLCCARCKTACIIREVFGAAWTRFSPWPVSLNLYVMSVDSRSCSARDHNWNMSKIAAVSGKAKARTGHKPPRINFHRVRDCST